MSSRQFPVRNSTRQGGLLSPYLFTVYVDGLSQGLTGTGLGCGIGNVTINHISYADDFCLMTSTIFAIKKLLKICQEYAKEHSIIFNPGKTVCQGFMPYSYDILRPRIEFCGKNIQWCDGVKYLGYDVSCRNRDASELERRRRDIYIRANVITSRFGRCSELVKRYLFNTYFSSIYCMSMWCPKNDALVKKLKVAYNDAFRGLFNVSTRASVSEKFLYYNIDTFEICRRKAVFSLLTRVSRSDNTLLQAIYQSSAFSCSSIVHEWKRLLLRNPDATIDTFYNL